MQGERLPVPGDLTVSEQAFWYRIPDHDRSMVAELSSVFKPKSAVLVDAARDILPGDYVLAYLKDFQEPLIRQFVADRPYAPGMAFVLEALNPAYRAIAVDDAERCAFIGRLISSHTPL